MQSPCLIHEPAELREPWYHLRHAIGETTMRRHLIVGLLAVSGATAAAQDARTWMFDDSSDFAALQYGTPESDDLVIAMTCEPKTRTMRIIEFVSAGNLTPGSPARLKLSNGPASLDYAGQAVANEMDGTVNVEVATMIDPKLFALLKAGPSLTVAVAGKQVAIPLKAAAAHVVALEKACLGKR